LFMQIRVIPDFYPYDTRATFIYYCQSLLLWLPLASFSHRSLAGETARILSTGDYGNTQILDIARSNALSAGSGDRITEAINYINKNIARFDGLDAMPLDVRSWRNLVGSVEPVDTMTRELMGDLRKAYVQVKDALERS